MLQGTPILLESLTILKFHLETEGLKNNPFHHWSEGIWKIGWRKPMKRIPMSSVKKRCTR